MKFQAEDDQSQQMGGGDATYDNSEVVTIEPLNLGLEATSMLSYPSSSIQD